jgi:HTH-type transcriptional repressor of NAD biosynthesis genes
MKSQRKYKSAFIVMKAMPLHKGHLYLIDTALIHSDRVTLLICSLSSEPIPGDLRYGWAMEIYKNQSRIDILHCFEDDLPQYPEEHINFWNIWVETAKKYCPNDIDVIFSSEKYGFEYAKKLKIKHFLVDIDRIKYPVSGTKIRTEPFKYWDYIPDVVKPYFVKRIAIMGPESVGKSILSEKLANYYNTNFVIEYGRTVYEEKNGITIDDFIPISNRRQMIEDDKIKYSNKLLFCDTEDITTRIFAEMYFPDDCKEAVIYLEDMIDNKKKYDLYILLKPDCEPIQDGTRNFLESRWEHYNVIKSYLDNLSCNYIEVSGVDWDNRFEISKISIERQFFNI